MMSFCKKSLHSFLGFSIPMDLGSDLKINPSGGGGGGIGLITATSDSCKTPNVLESSTVLNRSLSLPTSPPPPKKDPGGIGFIDEVGGGVDGLMCCTESLGFESCDERRVDDEIIEMCCTRSGSESKPKKVCGRRREVREFPPPLSSLNHKGQPCFFLRPVRRDGRLELMEVRIDRQEILRAYREDGRLRLHLVRDEKSDDIIGEKQVHHQDEEMIEQEEIKENEEAEEDEEIVEEDGEILEDEEERSEEWRYAVAGEGMRRCHEAVARHQDYDRRHHQHNINHHHNLHVWRQHCVTTS